ncbi:MAG: hypothetical protein HY006_03030 [Candidatus Sungbacteria bacterium]|nr:hypothetical protein [Candidatus Sungbacteria bacterium]
MQLRGINFRPVFNASGARGFFGEGYWFHRFWKWRGLTFENCGFTAKTTTLLPRLNPKKKEGNMPLKTDGITPAEWFPKCIVINHETGDVLNAVGLSGPGAASLLARGEWQKRRGEPWFLSFMAVGENTLQRLNELDEFVELLVEHKISEWNAKVGLELNFSCPNARHNPSHLVGEVGQALDSAAALRIPLQCKFNALAPVGALCEIGTHHSCDAIVMGNTIPWGELPELIPWSEIFGTSVSPLAKFGGGGLSGPKLLPIHCAKILSLRDCNFPKPIWACGGIGSANAVLDYAEAGADGFQIGSANITQPGNTSEIIDCANNFRGVFLNHA